MARCKDCIHENVCSALIEKGLPWNDGEYPAEAFCMAFRNNADVAPRAEVDFLKKTIAENAQKALEVTLEEVENAKREVARGIFEEIEKALNRKIARSKPQFEKLHRDEKDLSIWGYKDMGYFQGIVSTCEDLQDLIAELKKKYAGGRNERAD